MAVVGISPDAPDRLQAFAAKYRLPYPLCSDPDKKVMAKYGAWGKKMMYGKQVVGVIRSTTWVGPDGRVRRHWAKVPNAAQHPDKVLALLQAAEA